MTEQRDNGDTPEHDAPAVSDHSADSLDAATSPADPLMQQLKGMYDGIAEEPFPDHLLDLLKKLEEAEKRG